MQQEFDPDKSHLSAEAKAEFIQEASPTSSLSIVPGIGKVTTARLEAKGIRTVADLATTTKFPELKELVGPVNAHKIHDALIGYRETLGGQKREQNLEEAMESISLVDSKEDKSLASSIDKSSCFIQ
tara:strand:- start:480 stop:860 length:381 start_codon:yes stop_codon:yes gene_type:complete